MRCAPIASLCATLSLFNCLSRLCQVVLLSSLKSRVCLRASVAVMHARRATAGASGSRGARAGFAHFAARRSALKTSGAISQLTILSWLGAPSAVE
jgi:hypothetical protein